MSRIFRVNRAYIICFNKNRSQREIKYNEALFGKLNKQSSAEQELNVEMIEPSSNGNDIKSTADKKDTLAGIRSEINFTSINKCMFLSKIIKNTNAYSGTRLTS